MSEEKKKPTKKSKNVGKINWDKLEKEYISTKIGYRALAKKYKISERQVQRHGSEHGWVEKRRQFVGKVSAEVENALVQTETDKRVQELQAIGDAADILKDEILKACQDPSQLYKRSFYSTEQRRVIEYETSKIDGGALNQLVRALDKLTYIIRDVNGIRSEEKDAHVTVEFTTREALNDYGG